MGGRARRLFSAGTRSRQDQPDLIVTFTGGATEAAKQATGTIPIVMALGVYPVELGLIVSLARPGGNISGVAVFRPGLMAKRLHFS